LNIDKEYLDDHQVKLTVEIPAEEFETAKRRAARKIARSVKIPGFRPGKAPYDVIIRHVGEAAVIEDGLEILVTDVYPEIIRESGIKPYSLGTLESVEKLDPPVLEFIVPLEAEVNLGDYAAIRRDYEIKSITEEQVDEVLENIREQQAIVEPVDREALPGDIVTVKITGIQVGENEESEEVVVVKERTISLLINAPDKVDEAEWPYAGFSENLAKHKVGDQLRVIHAFDINSPYEEFRELEVQFSIGIESVRSRTLPELDDDFLSAIGDYESIEKLRDDILESLTTQSIQQYDNEYDEGILEEIINDSEIKYPPQMVDNQIDNLVDNLEHNLEDQNLDMDLYLKSRQITLDDLRSELRPIAESRLTRTLVLMEIAKLENITVEPGELQEETIAVINEMSSASESGSKKINKVDIENITGNVLASMLVSKAMTRFRQIASDEGSLEENQGELRNSTQEDTNQVEESKLTSEKDNGSTMEEIETESAIETDLSGNDEIDVETTQIDG